MKQVKYSHASDHACANEARAVAVPCCGWTGLCWPGSGSGRGCLSGGGRGGGRGGGGCLVVVIVMVVLFLSGGGLLVIEFFWPKYHFWLFLITMVTIL